MSIFTYHIPERAVYNALDVINILNDNYRHLVLAQNHGSFYSLGTMHESFTVPALSAAASVALLYCAGLVGAADRGGILSLLGIGLGLSSCLDFFKDKPGHPSISSKAGHDIVNNHFALDYSGKWYYYQEAGSDIFNEVFTAREISYLLNTNDIQGTLTHQVPDDYTVPSNGQSYYNVAVLDV